MVIMNQDFSKDKISTNNFHPQDHQCNEGIVLQPFLHQVSGRAAILSLDKTTVCKPVNYRELRFYKSLPNNIKQFTPRFKGIVNVNVEETKDGLLELTAYPSKEDDIENIDLQNDEGVLPPLLSSEDLDDVTINRNVIIERMRQSCPINNTSVNPWIYKVQREGLRRILQNQQKIHKCILLENVTSKFKKPCILDLKMGTRVHGDYDGDDKKKRHQAKCEQTTTKKLGVRLCGMQVYNAADDCYHCRDKYFGRTLDRSALLKSLDEEFFIKKTNRNQIIQTIIDRLAEMKRSLEELRSYRFYSSSLLIIYDGCNQTAKNLAPNVETRMVDFAKATNKKISKKDSQKSKKELYVHEGPDNGYITGLKTLIQMFNEIL